VKGGVPAAQLAWLEADLRKVEAKAIVFVHQRLDVTKQHTIKNAAAVRTVLEKSAKVIAVFQGHSHQNDYQEIAGIHYCTVADVLADGALRVEGFVRQKSYEWV
jgi:hypothetical protein